MHHSHDIVPVIASECLSRKDEPGIEQIIGADTRVHRQGFVGQPEREIAAPPAVAPHYSIGCICVSVAGPSYCISEEQLVDYLRTGDKGFFYSLALKIIKLPKADWLPVSLLEN